LALLEWGMHLAAQIDELRAGGSRVETILPDSNSRDAFGSNLMDLSTRPPPVEPVATKAEPLPRSSLNSGLTPSKSVDSAGVTTPAHASAAGTK
jgi:hypothetical protein